MKLCSLCVGHQTGPVGAYSVVRNLEPVDRCLTTTVGKACVVVLVKCLAVCRFMDSGNGFLHVLN